MIFDRENNEILLYGTIFRGDGMLFVSAFATMDGKYPKIKVRLHTDGGSVFDGNLIHNTLLNAKSEIEIQIDGVAASMGSVIMLAGKRISIAENGYILIHAPSGTTWGTAKDHESTANLLREVEKNFTKKLKARTGKSDKEVKKWIDGDNWFSAGQAEKAGLVDEIIGNVVDIDTEAASDKDISGKYGRFAALISTAEAKQEEPGKETKEEIFLNNYTEMKLQLIQNLGLTGVNDKSSDSAVINAVKEHYEAKVKEEKDKYEAEKKAKEDLETAAKAKDESLIDAAIAKVDGLSDKQKETYKKIGQDSGLEALQMVLDGLTPRENITGQLKTGASASLTASRSDWDWDKYQKEDPRSLEKMSKEDHVDHNEFKTLFKNKFDKEFKN